MRSLTRRVSAKRHIGLESYRRIIESTARQIKMEFGLREAETALLKTGEQMRKEREVDNAERRT